MSVLEVLQRAETSINTRSYSFHNWNRCACGHIAYAAGSALNACPLPKKENPLYHDALLTVAKANAGYYPQARLEKFSTYELARFVSNMVSGDRSHTKAKVIVRKGIAWETKRLKTENRWKLSDTPEVVSPRTEVDDALDRLLSETRESSDRIVEESQEERELVAF